MNAFVDVLGAALWPPADHASGPFATSEPAPKPHTDLLSARGRGRASMLTLLFAHVVEHASRQAGVDTSRVPIIYGSAYGEMATTIALLDMLVRDDGRLSPAKFQASVHNTAAGTISIAQRNRSFSTSIAAGHDTIAMALLEARAWLGWRPGFVVVACADEGAPEALVPDVSYAACAMALVLGNVPSERPALARLGQLGQTTTRRADGGGQDNPCAAGHALVHAVRTAATSPQRIELSRSARNPWQVDVIPPVSSS